MRAHAIVVVLVLLAIAGCGDSGSRGHGGGGMETPQTTRISVGAGGAQANGSSELTAISADGRIVAYQSRATNLTPDVGECTNGPCVFVYDRASATTTRLPVPGISVFGPSLSADGRFVAVTAQQSQGVDYAVFVFDRANGTIERIDVRPDGSPDHAAGNFLGFAAISADGRFVAFGSDADDLVAGDTNGVVDVFVRDRMTALTERVSVSSDGVEANATSGFFVGPALSADGRFVAFKSSASNLVSNDRNGTERCLELEGCGDIFVRDRLMGTTERVSVTSDGMEANGSSAINFPLSISADGRLVAFSSNATNLVPGDVDEGIQWFEAYVHDRETGRTERVSATQDGIRGNAPSVAPALSADGHFVTFVSGATNLLGGEELDCTGDCCGWIYVRELATGTMSIANVASDGSVSTRSCVFDGKISGDGTFVVFADFANDLVPSDTNGDADVFVRGPLRQ